MAERKPSEAVVSENFTFQNDWGVYRATAIYSTRATKPSSTVIFVHGLGANKDMYKWIGDVLAESGFVMVAFTVPQGIFEKLLGSVNKLGGVVKSFLGGSNMRDYFEDALRDTSFKQWSDGINSCIRAIAHIERLKKLVDGENIAAIGHSMGGLGALVAARKDSKLRGVVALAPPVLIKEAEGLPLAPQKLTIPVQLQVGTKEKLYENVKRYAKELVAPKVELIEIEGGDHVGFMDHSVVSLIGILSRFMEIPFVGEVAATISVAEQQKKSCENFVKFLRDSLH